MSVNIGQGIAPRSAEDAFAEARAAIDGGQLHRAIAIADAALRRGMVHPLFYNLKAHELEEQSRFAEATIYLQRALEMSPNDPQILHGVGLCFYKQGAFTEALVAFEAALRNLPDFSPSMYFAGACLEALGEDEDAGRCYRRAMDADPGYADPVAGLASIAARRGRSDEARRFAEQALKHDPRNIAAPLAIATADLSDGSFEEASRRLAVLLARRDLSPVERPVVAGLYADVIDAADEPDRAFAAYVKAKADQMASSGARVESETNYLELAERTTAAMTAVAPWPETPPPAARGDAPKTHAFLVGFPRSGTTLLEQVLAAHPDVVTLEERSSLEQQSKSFLIAEDGFARLLELDGAALEAERARYWEAVANADLDVAGNNFIDKLPLNTMKLPLIARLFPSARILFARRDPRDVVWSCFRRPFRLNAAMAQFATPEKAATFYDAVMRLAEVAEAKLPLHQHVVRYESLVDDFDGEAGAVATFLDLDWRDEMRDFAAKAADRPIRTPSAPQVRRGLYSEGVGQWRRYAEQLQPILPILQPWVEKFGYPEA